MKFSTIFAFAILLVLATTTMSAAQSKEETAQAATTTSKTILTKVKGITCATDLKTISANIKKLDGVTTCDTGKVGPTTTFKIAFNPTLVTEKDIHFAIQNTGGCKDPNEKPYKVKQ